MCVHVHELFECARINTFFHVPIISIVRDTTILTLVRPSLLLAITEYLPPLVSSIMSIIMTISSSTHGVTFNMASQSSRDTPSNRKSMSGSIVLLTMSVIMLNDPPGGSSILPADGWRVMRGGPTEKKTLTSLYFKNSDYNKRHFISELLEIIELFFVVSLSFFFNEIGVCSYCHKV